MIYWYHLTDGDLSRAHRVIDAFKEEDTVDVLGFQPISDPFDDWFYPAVTTPMTRARYYLFVPAIYRIIESRRLGYQAARERSRSLQHEVQQTLSKRELAGRGVIGRRSTTKLRRLPSAIYWSGLGKLGIRLPVRGYRNLHEGDYLRLVAGTPVSDAFETDDGVDEETEDGVVWDPKIPLTKILRDRVHLSKDLSLALPKAEADYLCRKFIAMPGGAESLLGVRLQLRISQQLEQPWDLLRRAKIPSLLQERLAHARSLSSAARALTIIYSDLVLEAQRKFGLAPHGASEQIEALKEEFKFWWENGRPFVARGWDIEAFRKVAGPAFSDADRRDFQLLIDVVRSSSGALECLSSEALRKIVVARERRNRPRKCRLCDKPIHRKLLKQYEVPTNAERRVFQLRYRHHRGDTIVRDLLRQPYKKRGDVQD